MACEEYAKRITDAAMAEPHPEPGSALLAHLSACASCAERFRRAQSLRSLIDRGVEALVVREPSPQFLAGVRIRIAKAPVPGRAIAWAPAGIAAASLAVLLTLWAVRAPRQDGGRSALVSNPASPPVVVAHTQSRPVIPSLRHAPPRSKHLADSPRPEVVVLPNQLAMALQLSQGLDSGRMNGQALFAAQKEFEKPLESISSEKDMLGDLAE